MERLRYALLATCVGIGLATAPALADNEPSGYTVKELLDVCMEGANDAREGATDELSCNQYIRGVTDTVVILRMDDKLCLPKADGARSGELSRAFIKWVYDDFDRRDLPAAQGVLEMLMDRYACNGK